MPARQGARTGTAENATKPEAKTTTTKKFVVEEKVKTFLGKHLPHIKPENIFEMAQKKVTDNGTSNEVCFVVFTDDNKQAEVNEEVNIALIKDCLFAYHTNIEEKVKGKQLMFSVISPETEDDTHILYVQEV